MKPRTKTIVTFSVLVILLLGLYFFTNLFSKVTGFALGEDEKIKLAWCLDGNDATLYISSTCPSCESQIDLFGNTAAKYIKIFLCNNVEECPELKGVPAWKINGKFYYGKKNFKELQKISGCKIE